MPRQIRQSILDDLTLIDGITGPQAAQKQLMKEKYLDTHAKDLFEDVP